MQVLTVVNYFNIVHRFFSKLAMKRLKFNFKGLELTGDFNGSRRFSLSVGVSSVAGVHSRLLRVDAQDVQRDIVEVIGGSDLVALK